MKCPSWWKIADREDEAALVVVVGSDGTVLAQNEYHRWRVHELVTIVMDELDQLAAQAFEGYVVRKDLARSFKGRYPVPEYVAEFLLGRYCASTDETEIQEGLNIVEAQMRYRTVRAGEEELFKSRARELGSVKLIDIITARLDARSDSYMASTAESEAERRAYLC